MLLHKRSFCQAAVALLAACKQPPAATVPAPSFPPVPAGISAKPAPPAPAALEAPRPTAGADTAAPNSLCVGGGPLVVRRGTLGPPDSTCTAATPLASNLLVHFLSVPGAGLFSLFRFVMPRFFTLSALPAARRAVLILALLSAGPAARAQLRLPNFGKKLTQAVTSRLSQGADKLIDKGLDQTQSTATKAVKDEFKPAAATPAAAGPATGVVSTRYDFVPGPTVLFEDRLLGEPVGEFPARWNLLEGSAEVVVADGQLAIQVANGGAISPLFKQATYLPAAFTLELDLYLAAGERCSLWLWDKRRGHQAVNGSLGELEITQTGIRVPGQQLGQELPGAEPHAAGGWHHLALAFNQRSLKAYLDRQRLLNVPNATGQPTALTLSSVQAYPNAKPLLVRNVRLAAGGKDLYARLAAEGRIVTHDILFAPGQAVIQPASQPTLDQLAGLLKSQPDLRFRIDGHTDADGDAPANLRLSQARAEAVRTALVRAGIAASRLNTRGLGESQPLDPSNTASAKAQNRRVEFVKL